MVVYLAAFAVTYAFVCACRHRLPSRENRCLTRRVEGGFVLYPRRAVPLSNFLLCFVLLFLLSALREGIGTDYYYTYTPRFQEILEGERTYYEVGFYWLNRLIGSVTANPQWLFVVTSFLFLLFVALAFYDAVEELPFCVVVLLVSGEYFISMNNLRQALASALVLFGYRFVRRRQWGRFALVVAIAATIHQSMLVFFGVLALLLMLNYIPLRWLLGGMGTAVVLLAVLLHVGSGVLEMMLPERLQYYLQEMLYTQPTIGRLRTLVNLMLLVFFLLLRAHTRQRTLDPFILVQFCGAAVCLFDGLLPAAYRILRVFAFWQLLAVPLAVEQCRLLPGRWYVKPAVTILLAVLCAYSLLFLGTEEVIPYRSIFHG